MFFFFLVGASGTLDYCRTVGMGFLYDYSGTIFTLFFCSNTFCNPF